tara:strand:+ start:673 stop:1020 length:348 start_codon:yes stop_codon:yes gene_type:complete
MKLSEKIKNEMIKRDFSYRQAGRFLNLSTDVLLSVVTKGKTSLRKESKKKLIRFCSDVTMADFTEIVYSSSNKPNNKDVDLTEVYARYNTGKCTLLLDELKEAYNEPEYRDSNMK